MAGGVECLLTATGAFASDSLRHTAFAPRAASADARRMTTAHPANDTDLDDPADVLISDRALDDLADRLMAYEDARAAWLALGGEVPAQSAPPAPAVRCAG